ncbi:LOW QUALITY PROTEIN: tetratricopeptide repeat protein 30A-like [Pteronotus mesoamericanus]|uniref:LOW QUALITY PROTEIN: tetratricopeptide repeat protein 30A-like n=1 Tax=Pteronotus mesoamericanus TaxID=1884717 RepID=UPI0023EC562E|nr:LOW QUALITY PROTEIN: tetratricopeptide repeat protein 30A-like [Pteronotus parnellii mesoamericanus]
MARLGTTQIPDGEFTAVVYRLIRDSRYADAVQLLGGELQRIPRSRAGLSLLGYCYYRLQEFALAAECYEQLSQLHPELEQYRLYQAQALYKACLYPEATRVAFLLLDNPAYHSRVLRLQAAIKYSEGDLPGARSLVEQLLSGEGGEDSGSENESDGQVNLGCLLCKEGQYQAACSKFFAALQASGYQPDLSYNLALAYYSNRQYASALKHIADIIEHGIRQHPELGVGMNTEGIDVHSVGNTLVLHQTALVEAFNLKAAIEYQLKNYEVAHETLTDMPPRAEEELDPVTLHNQALMNMDARPTEGFEKLQFLLQQNPFPPETFGNLLLLYCKYEYFDLAADVLAENAHLTFKLLTPYLYDFLDAVITCQTAPEEAFVRLDGLAGVLTEQLRKLTIQVQEARHNRDDEAVKKAVNEYDDVLEKYIPVLMAQAKIYWKRCFLSLLENRSKYTIILHDSVIQECIQFLEDSELYSRNIPAIIVQCLEERMHIRITTVT